MANTSGEERRPDPEELLDRYHLRDTAPPAQEEEDQTLDYQGPRARGRLRIYLGMAAGVGKTYAMLNEGHRRKARGTDVVIGFVETHKRPLTEQQIGDLEIVPRKTLVYRGATLTEMDVDAILARHPQVALVDELAHTNVPGSRTPKRYQDVEELLDAGIMVITTVNIQHLEGLNDIVESITGVRQRETLPDKILDEADEIELVDISPDALRSRMRHGNIYPQERIQVALNEYFTQGNLTALRELALRRTAEKTEKQLDEMMHRREDHHELVMHEAVTERVMVAFDARPQSKQLLRDGWRLARGLKAPLLAVTVIAPGGAPDPALQALLRLAGDLGAEIIQVQGRDVPAELARLARERHVTQVVLGQPSRSRWQEAFGGSIVNRLLRMPTGADIHVVPDRTSAAR
jgi:two-component system sensor histidine kinase KdpD